MINRKPGMFPTLSAAGKVIGAWLMALLVVAFACWLGWQIGTAAQRIGNPWNKIAQTISEAAK